jgi:imidazole glycerol-phosphate synthase subunit HisF
MRLIASVQISGPGRSIKTVRFEEKYYLGDPLNILRILNAKGAQEIALIDIKASKDSQIDYYEISRLSSEISVPFLYGGGISSNTDIRRLAGLGVERFMLSRFLFDDETFVKRLVDKLGSSSVSISLDIERTRSEGDNLSIILRGYPNVEIPMQYVIECLSKLNVGELVIRSVALDGSDGKLSEDFYYNLFGSVSFDLLKEKTRILIGSGIRTIEIAQAIKSKLEVDGFVVGSMVCLTTTGGILTTYPKEYSILSQEGNNRNSAINSRM